MPRMRVRNRRTFHRFHRTGISGRPSLNNPFFYPTLIKSDLRGDKTFQQLSRLTDLFRMHAEKHHTLNEWTECTKLSLNFLSFSHQQNGISFQFIELFYWITKFKNHRKIIWHKSSRLKFVFDCLLDCSVLFFLFIIKMC